MSVDLINNPQQLFKEPPEQLESEEVQAGQAALTERAEHD